MKELVIIPVRSAEELMDAMPAESMSWFAAHKEYETMIATEKGYGNAVRKAMKDNPGYDIYLTAADDFATPAKCLPALVEKVLEGYDLVVGWRAFLYRASKTAARGLVSNLYNKIFGKIFATGLHEHWGDTRAFSPRLVEALLQYTEENHFMWIPECIVAAQRIGYRVTEVPIVWDKRFTPSPMSLKRLTVDAKQIFGIIRLQRRMWEFRMLRSFASMMQTVHETFRFMAQQRHLNELYEKAHKDCVTACCSSCPREIEEEQNE